MIGTAVAAISPAVVRGRWWVGEFRPGRQPQWPAYVVAGVGWSVLVVLELAPLHAAGSASPHAGHGMHPAPVVSGAPTNGLFVHGAGLLGMLAVMASLVSWNVRYVALRASAADRGRVSGWVIGSWAVGWLPLLVVSVGLVWVTPGGTGPLVVATVLAIAWQWSPRKRLSVARCHRVVAPPLARRAARTTCLRYGLRLGWDCASSCAPMMVVMMATGHSVLVVAPLTALAWYERRRRPHHDPGRVRTSVVLAVVGLIAAMVGLAVE